MFLEKSNKPIITIALPVYNNSTMVGRAIESCLQQSDLAECEVLVVDNASTDGTSYIISDYLENHVLRCVRNERTVTMYENHNICLQKASGRYVLFCHSDDALDVDAVAILKSHLKRRAYPKRYVCWGYSLFRDYSRMLNKHGFRPGQIFAGELAAGAFLVGGVTPSGTCYTRDILDYGGFVYSGHRLAPSDSSTMVYLALKGFRFEMLEELLFFRDNASTAIDSRSIADRVEAYCDTYDHLRNKLDEKYFLRLLRLANGFSYPPYLFWYYMASFYPVIVLKEMIISIIKKPLSIRVNWLMLVLCKAITSLVNGRESKKPDHLVVEKND